MQSSKPQFNGYTNFYRQSERGALEWWFCGQWTYCTDGPVHLDGASELTEEEAFLEMV